MPNQYGARAPIFTKCEDKDCSTIIRRTPSQMAMRRRMYCSRECQFKNVRPKVYTPEVVAQIKLLRGKLSSIEIAKKLGLNLDGYKKAVAALAKADPTFPTPLPGGKPVKNKAPRRTGEADRRQEPKHRGNREHGDRKPPVNDIVKKKEDARLPNRVIVPGPISIKFKKGNTNMTARDVDHYNKIVKTFAHLGEYSVSGLPVDSG